MDRFQEPDPSSISAKTSSTYHASSLPLSQSAWLEIRLFYVRVAPCVVGSVPDHLTLRHPPREIGASLEMNGVRVPASETAYITLRRDRLDKESSEVTYVSTETVRVYGAVDFEVYENDDMILCGNLDRIESPWSKGISGDPKTGWGMDCYMSMGIGSGSGHSSGCSSSFFQPKLGVSSPSVEIYIAGCCGGVPVILTKTIHVSPRRKAARQFALDAIPEDDEVGKDHHVAGLDHAGNGSIRQRKLQIMEPEADEDEIEGKVSYSNYPEEMYMGEDGELSWFNAGVRVGVGIGLGMCVGIGIGVGLLMRSYQTTTRNFRRRFL